MSSTTIPKPQLPYPSQRGTQGQYRISLVKNTPHPTAMWKPWILNLRSHHHPQHQPQENVGTQIPYHDSLLLLGCLSEQFPLYRCQNLRIPHQTAIRSPQWLPHLLGDHPVCRNRGRHTMRTAEPTRPPHQYRKRFNKTVCSQLFRSQLPPLLLTL